MVVVGTAEGEKLGTIVGCMVVGATVIGAAEGESVGDTEGIMDTVGATVDGAMVGAIDG